MVKPLETQISNINLNKAKPTSSFSTGYNSYNQVGSDTYTSSTKQNVSPKKASAKDYAKIIATILGGTIIACGAAFGIKSLANHNLNKLSKLGLGKGEINETLFNFIKKIDPHCKHFSSKQEIIELNSLCNDKNFKTVKKLIKYPGNPSKIKDGRRFSIKEVNSILKTLNNDNEKFLDQVLTKLDSKTLHSFSPNEISEILSKINSENSSVASSLIEIIQPQTFMDKTPPSAHLIKALSDINKDNLNIYKMLLNSRKSGANTTLKCSEINELAQEISKHKNPKAMNFFLNLESGDGLGYKIKDEDLNEITPIVNDNLIETYQKIFTKDSLEITDKIKLINSANAKTIEKIEEFNKTVPDKYSAISKENMKDITENNNKLIETMIDKLHIDNPSHYIREIMKKTKDNKKLADKILATLENNDMNSFHKLYNEEISSYKFLDLDLEDFNAA